MYKRTNIKYGKLPAMVEEETSRNKIFLDIIDYIDLKNTYVIKKGEEIYSNLKYVTLMQYNDKRAISIVNLFKSTRQT